MKVKETAEKVVNEKISLLKQSLPSKITSDNEALSFYIREAGYGRDQMFFRPKRLRDSLSPTQSKAPRLLVTCTGVKPR